MITCKWRRKSALGNWRCMAAFLTISTCFPALAQPTASDSTISKGEKIYSVLKKFENLKLSGYIQPQFQWAQSAGAPSYAGGNFAPNSNNRFMLRRGRIRVDYSLLTAQELPSVSFAFQFDVTERGVQIRDFYGKIYENRFSVFHVTTGMFPRPFGFEVNFSSSQRDSPERGRMSQILFRTERDLGVMLSFEPQRDSHPLKNLHVEAGLFNGTGVAGPTDYDSHKDFIGRLSLKPMPLTKKITVSGSVSHYNGGIRQFGPSVYRLQTGSAEVGFVLDSAASNVGKIAVRRYYGADAQLKISHRGGATELRGEYITGRQPGTATSTEVPGLEPTTDQTVVVNNQLLSQKIPLPIYYRQFNGAYFYLVQDLKSAANQLVLKYDWYDPNTQLTEAEIGRPASNTNEADIKFSTWGGGYIRNFNDHLRLTVWYDRIKNLATQLPKYTQDRPDDIFTVRVMYRF